MNVEIELRYEVLDVPQLRAFLSSFQRLGRKRQVDSYLDNPEAELYQKGIFIRIRDNEKLDFKFNRSCINNPGLAIQDYCEEYSFSLPLQQADLEKMNCLLVSLQLNTVVLVDLESFKKANALTEHYVVDKIRTSYSHDSFFIAVDQVANLGTFLEIEMLADTIEDLDVIRKAMELLLVNLSLKPLKTGYGTLLLRKKNFQQYLQGRFILEEDKRYKNMVT